MNPDIYEEMELFFSVMFNAPVPALQPNYIQSVQGIWNQLAQEFPDMIDTYEQTLEWDALWNVPGVDGSEQRRIILNRLEELRNEMTVDYWKIVDAGWLQQYLNLQNKAGFGLHQLTADNSYAYLQKIRGRKTVSICPNRKTGLWIWSDGEIFVVIEGTEAMVMTRTQMQNQMFLQMITGPYVIYTLSDPIINWTNYSPFRFISSRNPKNG